ncbi:unnamed protein product [Phytophthora fragariaefolia]|uniref:Unnamed protein product n=1 Tax=Phytophthora fragariaefolia TaxID=1490495 RepID=A0A9W6XSB3_9STRA|nr:unnamed protein product [Phytophthora fragariaefolia]
MVNAVRTKTTDSKNTMALLHQRFGRLNMPAVKAMVNKQKVGVKINAKDLNSYDCVACTAGKAKRMHHARRSLRELQPLSILMMDVCSMGEPTARGATMFLYVVDEVTCYKWALKPTLPDDHVGADPPAAADAPAGAGSDAVSGEPRGTSAAVRSASKSSGRIVENSSKGASSPDEQPGASSPSKRITRKRRKRKRGKTVEKVTSAFENQPPPVEPCVKRPRRTQKRNSDTFAAVIRFETIRAAIYYAVQRGWAVLQYDAKTAFLYGNLTEEIFMEQPPGFQEDGPDYVCRLLKSLYGLKQAPHIWNKALHAKLVTMGFERLDSDFGLCALKKDGEVRMLLTVYVDDILLMGTPGLCTATAAALKESFEMITMGNVKYLLSVEILIARPRRQIIYSQQQYVVDVLKEYHMSTCNGCATPEATSPSKAGLPETNDIPPYRELVDSL